MSKERTTGIDSNSIIVFNGDIRELKSIPKDFCGDIIVHGDIDLNLWRGLESLIANCSIWCEGSIRCYHIKINGSLYVNGMIRASGDIICSEDIICTDIIDCNSIVCGGQRSAKWIDIGPI